MSFAFRKFSFFQQQEIKSHGLPANASCYTEGRGLLFVGCDNGAVQLVDDGFQAVWSFTAHGHKVLRMAWAQGKQLLLTLGVEEPGITTATIKVWELDKLQAAAAAAANKPATAAAAPAPAPLKLQKVFNSKYPESEVTALAVTEAAAPQLTVAVGLASGNVYIFQGDTAGRGKLHHTCKLVVRPDSGDLWCVTALAFPALPQQQQQQQHKDKQPAPAKTPSSRLLQPLPTTPSAAASAAVTVSQQASQQPVEPLDSLWLYVVTESQTMAFNVADGSRNILDQQGVRTPNCAVLKESMLVVARDDALYDYTLDTRAGCTVLDGKKQWLGLLRRYLVVVTDDTSDDGVATATLALVDVRNKLLAGSFTLQSSRLVVAAMGSLAVLLANGRLLVFHEVELASQLDTLFKRSLHKLALDLATAQQADASTVAGIHQRWGDHLYGKGEYDAAMGQYLDTIGHLEPSYVIRRFLDAQRIHSLTSYLEQLHARGLASSDHTTLLLNCYTKLKDVEKLDSFIHRGDSSNRSSSAGSKPSAGPLRGHAQAAAAPVPSFDLETAFKVLRSAGYYAHALWVAERAAEPKWQLDVLLEDMQSYEAALAFVDTLSRPQMAEVLQRYGKLLITARPEDTTRLLMELCIPAQPSSSSQPDKATAAQAYVASVSDFEHLYSERPTALMLLCEFVLNSQTAPPGEQMLFHTLLSLYLTDRLLDEPSAEEAEGPSGPGGLSEELQPQLRRTKARELLQRGWQPHMAASVYDPEHALVLCRLHDFKPGLIFLYDKLRMHRELLQVYMDAHDHQGLISACIQFGDAKAGGDPQLWADALEYLCARPEGDDCTQQITQVLAHIEGGAILPPLVVLQTLAKNTSLKVSLVKGYVGRQLAKENTVIQQDRDAIARLQAETAAMKAEVVKLKTQPRVFQNSRCAAAGQALELPVVHFLCGHSFNVRSLGENDRECPLCTPDFKRVLEIRRNMKAGALQQDRFFTELRETADGFSVVAEHFGRGLMNMTSAAQAAAAAAGTGL